MKIKAKKKLQLNSEFNQALVPLSYRVTPIHAVIVQWVGSNLIWSPITYCLHKWGPIKVRRDWQQPCISSHVILSLWYHYDEKVIGFRANTIYASFSLRVLNLKTCDFRVHVCHFLFPNYTCANERASVASENHHCHRLRLHPLIVHATVMRRKRSFFSGGIMSVCFTAAVHWQRRPARAVIELTDWPLQDKHSHSTASSQWGGKKTKKQNERCNLSLRKE